jgi:hypothetical protein
MMLIVGLGMIGCSGGGGGGSSAALPVVNNGGATPAATTSVSGTTGSTSSTSGSSAREVTSPTEDGVATLVLDSNSNGKFDDKEDLTYTTPVVDGSFSFDSVAVNESNATKAMLTVEQDGFAPFIKMLDLTKDDAITVLATLGEKPLFTEVINLSVLSKTQRATSFVRFGLKEGDSGVESFSSLMSMSEFKAMSDVNLSGDGTVSESIIPVSAFPKDLKVLKTEMQSFNSSDPEDFKYFPGKLTGHGKLDDIKSNATSDTEVALESAGFDLIKLLDQNDELVDLESVKTSKLSALAGRNVCSGMQWTRRLRPAEVAVIKGWGDDDNNSKNGYQVPIWSNDNRTRSWQYVGLATVYNLNTSILRPIFKIC